MAEQLSATATPTVASNSKERKKAIVQVAKKLQSIEERMKKLREERKSVMHTQVKGFLGMKVAHFNIAYAAYCKEGDERKQLMDTMEETFNALGVGGQIDWITEVGKTEQKAAEATAEQEAGATSEELENQGYRAAERGAFSTECPYESVRGKTAWISGWDRWQQEKAEAMAPPPVAQPEPQPVA